MNVYFNSIILFKSIINIITDVTDIGTWHFYPDKITIQNMSKDANFMECITIDNSDCQYYNCETYFYITFSYSKLLEIINDLSNDTSIKIIYELYTDFLTFVFKENYFNINLELKLEKQVKEAYNCPDYNPECVVTLKSKDFKNIINRLSKINKTCTIIVNRAFITFNTINNETNYSICINNLYGCTIVHKKDINIKLDNNYLMDYSNLSDISEYIILYLINYFPIKIEYQIGHNSVVHYYQTLIDI